MRLLMFRHEGDRRLGALRSGTEDEVVDLSDVAPDLIALIDAGRKGLDDARKATTSARRTLKLKDLAVLAPIDPPRGNIIAIGRNYQKHAEETAGQGEVQAPTVFTKAITSITGPYDDIPIDPAVSDEMDWEVELGVVIGKRGANIRRAQAMGYVFGYTVFNDVSARDMQFGWGGQFFKGKSLDRSSPTGPWVVTSDEVPDPQNLHLRLTVNGVVKQDASTRDMIHPIDAIVEWISKGMTLLPGAVIATGTPDGVGFARKPPEYLHAGDVMETVVQGVGMQRNRIVAAGRD